MDLQALQEAFRRRSGQQPSSAGIPGGAPSANAVTSQNPLAQFAAQNMQAQGQGLPQSMSEPGIKQLKESQPGEAEIIVKALIQRLRTLGQPQNVERPI